MVKMEVNTGNYIHQRAREDSYAGIVNIFSESFVT